MIVRTLILILSLTAVAQAETTLEVIHKKKWRPDGHGQITIAEDGIAFKAAKEKNSRHWSYQDIQYFDRLAATEFILLSYEDVGWQFGRDRQYHFVMTSGELNDRLFEMISGRMGRPMTDRVVPPEARPGYKLPSKHVHRFGGCEGELRFTEDTISYATEHRKDARQWQLTRDVQSVWSMHPYHLELHVRDNNRREFSRTRVYKFDLKRPLDEAFYRELKLRLYGLETGKIQARLNAKEESRSQR